MAFCLFPFISNHTFTFMFEYPILTKNELNQFIWVHKYNDKYGLGLYKVTTKVDLTKLLTNRLKKYENQY